MIEKVLELSTTHIPHDIWMVVNHPGNDEPQFGDLRYVDHHHGFIVFVALPALEVTRDDYLPEEIWAQLESTPDWFHPILFMAITNHCTLINFDNDAVEVNGLPVYEH